MNRTPNYDPPQLADKLTDKFDEKLVPEVRHYKLITPLYGGGVKPATSDPVTTIRATEVRGHLRFWWRACCAANFSSLVELKKSEGRLWGDTSNAAKVLVEVNIKEGKIGKPETVFKVGYNPKGKLDTLASDKVAPYAAFPMLPEDHEKKKLGWQSESVQLGIEFTVTLRYPKDKEHELFAALWAWEIFGGIGARTRRGFGAIQLTHINSKEVALPETPEQVKEQILEHLRDINVVVQGNVTETLQHIPRLSSTMLFKISNRLSNNPLQAWQFVIDKLKQFRQLRYDTKYGLSKWPEANSIRGLNSKPAKQPKSEPGYTLSDPKYPRAEFGLPIIFHLPHDPSLESHTLQGLNSDRLASPLILRPIACANGKAVWLAAILDAPRTPSDGLMLKTSGRKLTVTSKVTPSDADVIPPLNNVTDPLKAFLNFLKP